MLIVQIRNEFLWQGGQCESAEGAVVLFCCWLLEHSGRLSIEPCYTAAAASKSLAHLTRLSPFERRAKASQVNKNGARVVLVYSVSVSRSVEPKLTVHAFAPHPLRTQCVTPTALLYSEYIATVTRAMNKFAGGASLITLQCWSRASLSRFKTCP